MNFNEFQMKAIQHGDKPMLVIAGPGSGKTTVLTNRIKYLIEEHKIPADKILVITFTKAAALEMQKRFERLTKAGKGVTFGTFHAVFFYILKAAYNFNVNSIIKDEDKKTILRTAIEKSGMVPEDYAECIENLLGEISRVKSEGVDINVYYSANCPEEAFRSIYKYYEGALKKQRLIDFDDMLLYCYELFKKRPDILKQWQKRYTHILIDEFQDINKVQYEVIKMLALPENNLFVVGDDDQSIYGFRGSKPEIMLNFEKDYPNAKKVKLDINYRCSGNIVAAAGLVIKNNKVRFDKNIRTDNEKGNKVDIVEFETTKDEYLRVVDEIRKSFDAGNKYHEHAILYRTNHVIFPLVRYLIEYNIPFVLKDGIPNIFEHWIAKDYITYMKVALGSRSRGDFIRIMNKPKRYIGRDYLTEEQISFDELEKYYEDKPWMYERLDKMKADLEFMSKLPPYAMINYLRKSVGYDDYLTEYAKEKGLDIKELLETADEIMDSTKNVKTYEAWLEYIEKYTLNLKESNSTARQKNNGVILTTMHGSKGLEYNTVFIIDANEGITPHKKSVSEIEISEERRMFYVAMTRAIKNLHIYYSKTRYNKEMEVSRFVAEIMEE